MSDTEDIPGPMDLPPMHDITQRRIDVVKVVVSLCFTYTLCIALTRVWIRRNIYGPDDWVALAATILSVAQFVAEYVCLGLGLGLPIDALRTSPHLLALNKANLGGVVLWVLSLFTSKCAAIVFMSRFAQPGRHKKEILSVLVIVVVLGFGSLLSVIVDCRVVSKIYYWDFPRHVQYCPNPYLRWQILTAFDIITEALILIVPIDLIWSLQMPSSRKIGIITAFYIRIPVLAFALTRDHYVRLLSRPTIDAGLTSNNVIIWHQLELSYSIAAATLMCLKPLVKDFNTSFGLGGETVRTHATTGYILSQTGEEKKSNSGMGSRLGQRIRMSRKGSSYGKGSVDFEMTSRAGESRKDGKVLVSVSEDPVPGSPTTPNERDGANGTTTTTVAHDPEARHLHSHSAESRGRDDILITHRVEQSVRPRHMV